MRFLFTTQRTESVSTIINLENFKRLAEFEGISFEAFNTDYANYDVILFMGLDPQVEAARASNPNAMIGVVDARPTLLELAKGADFLVSNGPEMSAMAARYFGNIFEYPIYPEVPARKAAPAKQDRIIICYHGNRAHAVSMFPHATRAIEELSKTIPLELRLIYNIDNQSIIPDKYLPKSNVLVNHVQWHPAVYSKEMVEADIGIAPNLTPMHNIDKALTITAPIDPAFGAHPTEQLVRYKPTSNAGRILTFAQHGIPIVADMHPSSAQIIRNGINGYLVNDAYSWFQALNTLASHRSHRISLGAEMMKTFQNLYSIDRINSRFINFCKELTPGIEAPESLGNVDWHYRQIDKQSIWRTLGFNKLLRLIRA